MKAGGSGEERNQSPRCGIVFRDILNPGRRVICSHATRVFPDLSSRLRHEVGIRRLFHCLLCRFKDLCDILTARANE